MAENKAVTKEDLKHALNEVVAHLTGLIKETAAATEAKLTAEMDRRFGELRGEVNGRFEAVDRRFDRADRERRAFREEVNNRFYEIDGKIMHRFDLAKEHTDEVAEKLSNEWTTKLERQAGVTDNLRLEQTTMGVVQDQTRSKLDETTKSHDAEIKDLKRRVTVLEEEVFPSSANKD
jgi:hypothetical protein